MSDEKTNPDELTKTTGDDVKLAEADLNNVSGGAADAFLKLDQKLKLEDKTSPSF